MTVEQFAPAFLHHPLTLRKLSDHAVFDRVLHGSRLAHSLRTGHSPSWFRRIRASRTRKRFHQMAPCHERSFGRCATDETCSWNIFSAPAAFRSRTWASRTCALFCGAGAENACIPSAHLVASNHMVGNTVLVALIPSARLNLGTIRTRHPAARARSSRWLGISARRISPHVPSAHWAMVRVSAVSNPISRSTSHYRYPRKEKTG